MAANDTISPGWHDEPNLRGTFDIIKTCIGTIFLLCWSSVCPSVPSPDCGFWAKFFMKLQLFLLAILGPDFIFMVALGQANAAWRAREAFRREGYTEWGLRHCFFVNMGGLHLNFRDRRDAGLPSFPVDCEQVLHLVQRKYMPMPSIDRDDIDDRNKSDQLARAITIVQTLWFTISTLARVAEGLFITTLELTTLAFVFLMTCCAVCWWYKPMDVSRSIIVDVEADLSTVLREAGAPTPPRGRTPLSFLNRREWFMSQFWFSYIQILRKTLLLPESSIEPAKATHFPSIDFQETAFAWDCVFGWLIPAYSAIFLAGWNFYHPTTIERTLWRVSAIMCLVYGILGSLLAFLWHNRVVVSRCLHRLVASVRCTRPTDWPMKRGEGTPDSSPGRARERLSRQFDWMRNLSSNHDPAYQVPARLWLLTTALCAVYCFSRAYILVEDFISLRALPESAFQTVQWSQFSPIL